MSKADELHRDIRYVLKRHPQMWWVSETDSRPEAVIMPFWAVIRWKAEGGEVQHHLLNQLTMSTKGDGWIELYNLLAPRNLIAFKRPTNSLADTKIYILTRIGWQYVGISALIAET